MADLVAFLGVSLLVIVTPGQDTALTVRNTLVGGRAGGFSTAVGVSTGQATWTLATSVGVGALILASEPIVAALKVAGGAYLIVLGSQALVGALRSGDGKATLAPDRGGRSLTPTVAFRQGLLSNLGNPKMLAFFTSLLPQFAGSFPSLLGLGLLFSSLTLVWLSAYALAVTKTEALLRRPSVRRAVQASTGTVLMALGLRLATEQR